MSVIHTHTGYTGLAAALNWDEWWTYHGVSGKHIVVLWRKGETCASALVCLWRPVDLECIYVRTSSSVCKHLVHRHVSCGNEGAFHRACGNSWCEVQDLSSVTGSGSLQERVRHLASTRPLLINIDDPVIVANVYLYRAAAATQTAT